MSRELQAALHDVGKLVETHRFGVGEHDFHIKVDDTKVLALDELHALGLSIPATRTWAATVGHHRPPQDADLLLLTLADHAASAASRAYDDEDKQTADNPVTTREGVHRLWRPGASEHLRRIDELRGLRELFDFLSSDPDDGTYLAQYADLLMQRPEDLRKPNDVASLYTHSRLVGKFYRFFRRYATVVKRTAPGIALEFGGRPATNTASHAEHEWQVWLTLGEVRFAQEPIRARDLNVFDRLATAMGTLAERDEVLFCASNQFLAILPPEEEGGAQEALQDLLAPVLGEGFHAQVELAKVFLSRDDPHHPSMYQNPLPRVLRERASGVVEQRAQLIVRAIPDPQVREQKLRERREQFRADVERRFPRRAVYSSLPDTFGASICEICQMEEGTIEWPKRYVLDRVRLCQECRTVVEEGRWPPNPDALCADCVEALGPWLEEPGGRELLGERCYALRSRGVRLKKLAGWTERGREQVAWVRVILDVPRLVEALDTLYTEYVADVAPDLIQEHGKPGLRMSVVAEFQWDYEEFLRRFNAAVVDHFRKANVEQVFGGDGSELLCVRLSRTRDLLCLLKLYQDLIYEFPGKFFCRHDAHRRHATPLFPKFEEMDRSPVQLLVTASRSHYPFFQHWRQMERERGRSDVYLHVVGSGELRVRLKALGPVLLKAQYRHRRAFHTLAEIARLSEALARLRMHDRVDRQQWVYRRLREDLLPLGLDYQSILTLVKIMGG